MSRSGSAMTCGYHTDDLDMAVPTRGECAPTEAAGHIPRN
jgi:hypothetical protein